MQTAGGAPLSAPDEAADHHHGDPSAESVSSESPEPTGSGPIENVPTRRRLMVVLAVVASLVWVLDQGSKLVVVAELSDRPPIELLGGLLKLTLVYNEGAAFGLASGYTALLTLLAASVVVFVVVLARRLASLPWALAFGFLLGGALGNLTDRIFRDPAPLRGRVVDFLELPNWPVFNLADTSICCAAALIVFLSLTGRHLDGTRLAKSESSQQPDGDQQTASGA